MNLKLLTLTCLMTLCFNGCGTDPVSTPNSPISSNWIPTSAVVVIANLDLSQLVAGTTQSSDVVVACDGSFGNSGDVNGVASGFVRTTGDASQGLIQFGNVKYYGASDTRCHDISKEEYSYNIVGKVLTLCLTNPSYPYCTTYESN